jgi:uncharacterized protein (DUF58 family)
VSAFGPRLREALLAGRREGRRGLGAASLRRSDGYEFAELRGYVEGDDPRRIDWAATARAGALQTRVILEERALVLAVALDASLSMQVGRTRSNHALACEAAELWYSAALDDDRCARLGREPLVLGNVRGRAGALVCVAQRDAPGTPFEGALRLALAAVPRGARLLVVSDFFELDTLEPLLRACAARFDLTALLARDPWHAGLPLRGFVRLRDAESGRTVRAYVGARARRSYPNAVAERESAVLARLRAAGARTGTLDEARGARAALGGTFGL